MAAISPEEYLGFVPGDDRKLASWCEITGYLERLAKDVGRIRWVDMGASTEGRPFYYLVISSEETISNLEEYKDIQALLADQRGCSEKDVSDSASKGKTVVMISCSIHATEVGGTQMAIGLAHELATRNDPEVKQILDNVILLLIPCLNPDGLDLVVDWYEGSLGTPHEGTVPPFLYHKYAGHDNNRDWFMLNLVENRLTVEKLHNVWRPHIVFDIHQMGELGFRMFLPPFMDPYDPNVDPILAQEIAELGIYMAGEVLGAGKTGVSWLNTYDAYAPARAYQHYHGGVRILSEVASARLASPTRRTLEELRPTRDGADPRQAVWNHPVPWPGGEWRLKDIVEYDRLAAFGCLNHAAKNRERWIRNFRNLSRRAIEKQTPYAFVIAAKQSDPVAAYELLEVLWRGNVEIHRATQDFDIDGAVYEKGSHVVKMAQPYGAFAKTLLEVQDYPDLRQYPGGPPRLPYDVTGHTLPLLMGVKVSLAAKPFDAELEMLDRPCFPEGGIVGEQVGAAPLGTPIGDAGDNGLGWYALSPSSNASVKVVNRILEDDAAPVYRTAIAFSDEGLVCAPGSFVVSASYSEQLCRLSREEGVQARPIAALRSPKFLLKKPRVGVYKSYRGVADEGWLRYVLERYGFTFESLTNQGARGGDLRSRLDTVIFPSQNPDFISRGNPPGMYPDRYSGGLGAEGKDAIAAFVEQGGTAVFVNAACGWAVGELALPATNVVAGVPRQEFFCPGSILKTVVDTEHPLGFGLPREHPVAFEMSPAWDVRDGAAVACYPAVDPLLSGWLLGGQMLQGKTSLAEFEIGQGRAILIGFNPYFRAQARGSYKIVFNAIYRSCWEAV